MGETRNYGDAPSNTEFTGRIEKGISGRVPVIPSPPMPDFDKRYGLYNLDERVVVRNACNVGQFKFAAKLFHHTWVDRGVSFVS